MDQEDKQTLAVALAFAAIPNCIQLAYDAAKAGQGVETFQEREAVAREAGALAAAAALTAMHAIGAANG